MTKRYKFRTLASSGINLVEAEVAYAGWAVAVSSGCNASLYDQTNVDAFVRLLRQLHGESAVYLGLGDCGEVVAIVNPDHDKAIASAIRLAPEIGAGNHFDETLFTQSREKQIDDYWKKLSIPERIWWLQEVRQSVGLACADKPPDVIRVLLAGYFE